MRVNNSVTIDKKRLVVSPQAVFAALLFVVWTRYTLCAYVIAVIKRLPLVWIVGDMAYPTVIIILSVMSIPYIRKRLSFAEIMIYSFVLASMALSVLFFENNLRYLQAEASMILLEIAPMIFLGACYDHKKQSKVLYWASILSIVSRTLFQFYSSVLGNQMEYDSMGTAYRMLPSTMYLIYWAFQNKKLKDWIIAAVSILLMFIYGTRGPILCISVYICVGYLYTTIKERTWKSFFLRLIVVTLTAVWLFSDAIEETVRALQELFKQLGMSTRVFDYFLEGTISDVSGRDGLNSIMQEAIRQSPLLGYGLMGDRAVLNGSYAHNLFLELWCQFGIFLGSFLIIGIVWLPIKAISKQRKHPDVVLYLLMLVCMVFAKLMVSNSYIRDEYFFFMLGACLVAIRSVDKTDTSDVKGEQTP